MRQPRLPVVLVPALVGLGVAPQVALRVGEADHEDGGALHARAATGRALRPVRRSPPRTRATSSGRRHTTKSQPWLKPALGAARRSAAAGRGRRRGPAGPGGRRAPCDGGGRRRRTPWGRLCQHPPERLPKGSQTAEIVVTEILACRCLCRRVERCYELRHNCPDRLGTRQNGRARVSSVTRSGDDRAVTPSSAGGRCLPDHHGGSGGPDLHGVPSHPRPPRGEAGLLGPAGQLSSPNPTAHLAGGWGRTLVSDLRSVQLRHALKQAAVTGTAGSLLLGAAVAGVAAPARGRPPPPAQRPPRRTSGSSRRRRGARPRSTPSRWPRRSAASTLPRRSGPPRRSRAALPVRRRRPPGVRLLRLHAVRAQEAALAAEPDRRRPVPPDQAHLAQAARARATWCSSTAAGGVYHVGIYAGHGQDVGRSAHRHRRAAAEDLRQQLEGRPDRLNRRPAGAIGPSRRGRGRHPSRPRRSRSCHAVP